MKQHTNCAHQVLPSRPSRVQIDSARSVARRSGSKPQSEATTTSATRCQEAASPNTQIRASLTAATRLPSLRKQYMACLHSVSSTLGTPLPDASNYLSIHYSLVDSIPRQHESADGVGRNADSQSIPLPRIEFRSSSP